MKKKKFLVICGAVALFAIAAVVLVKLYPTLELYYTAKRTGQDVITVTNSEGETSQMLGIQDYTPPTIPPDALQEGSKGTTHSFSLTSGGSLDYTLNDVHFYDSFADSGIDPSELMRSEGVTQLLEEYQFLVADFTVTSHGAVPDYELNNGYKR